MDLYERISCNLRDLLSSFTPSLSALAMTLLDTTCRLFNQLLFEPHEFADRTSNDGGGEIPATRKRVGCGHPLRRASADYVSPWRAAAAAAAGA